MGLVDELEERRRRGLIKNSSFSSNRNFNVAAGIGRKIEKALKWLARQVD